MKIIICSKRFVRHIVKTGGAEWTFQRWPELIYLFRDITFVKKRFDLFKNATWVKT